MKRSPAYCGVILNIGGNAALLPWPVESPRGPLLAALIDCLATNSEMVLLATTAGYPDLAPVVYARGGYLVEHPSPTAGRFALLRMALSEVLNRGRDTALVVPAEQVPMRSETIAALCKAYNDAPHEVWAVRPVCGGKPGHPLLAGRDLMEAMLLEPDDATPHQVLERNKAHVLFIEVDDPATVTLAQPPVAPHER